MRSDLGERLTLGIEALRAAGDSLAGTAHAVRSHLLLSVAPDQLQAARRPSRDPWRPSFGDALDQALAGRRDLAPTLVDGGHVLSLDALRRLVCDTTVSLVALADGSADPLQVGRSARTVSGPQFTALVQRDRHCVAAGCYRPPATCIAHHVRHWLDGGRTDLDNLVLLCHAHHHDHHDRGHDLPHRDGDRWLTQDGWRGHGWTTAA